ncbi:exonuclease domain-containing protein, partial [Streptomyces albidoflavus]
MGWHRELLIGFDLETTGTDPREARIVTAAVIEVADGERRGHRTWLADPGIPIPAGATAVHGITDARGAPPGAPPPRGAGGPRPPGRAGAPGGRRPCRRRATPTRWWSPCGG